ncbi:MAG TPA: anti-sigma factor, partial [Stenomitos sp.]
SLGLGLDNVFLHRKVALQNTALAALQNAQTEVFSMKATPAALGASGRVLLDVQGGHAVIVMHKLPPLPKGEAYHLWAFTPQAKVLCGRFNSTQADGQVNLSLDQAKQLQSVRFMRISREAVAPPQRKPKQRVLVLTSEL